MLRAPHAAANSCAESPLPRVVSAATEAAPHASHPLPFASELAVALHVCVGDAVGESDGDADGDAGAPRDGAAGCCAPKRAGSVGAIGLSSLSCASDSSCRRVLGVCACAALAVTQPAHCRLHDG